MAGKASETTYTFAVTFVGPAGMNIPNIRSHIREALLARNALEITNPEDVKIHLQNKETSYGKR
jgi:hypothetical protein